MDLLSHVLDVSGVRGTVAARVEAGRHWGFTWNNIQGAAVHTVTAGVVWLSLPGRPPLELMPGDVVLLPTGMDHSLSSAPGVITPPCEYAAAGRTQPADGALRFGDGDVQTHILSASYTHDPAVTLQIMRLLPEVVHLRADHGGSCLADTVRLLGRELTYPQMGASVVLNRLVDILLVQLLRVWLAVQATPLQGSWLGVLTDPQMAEALSKLHQQPERSWTTEGLAAELGISRATLARRFQAVVGQSPVDYLTQWRMDLAARRLQDTDESLEEVAEAVGYTSVYAFSRAFSRERAQSPGRYRANARLLRRSPSTSVPVGETSGPH